MFTKLQANTWSIPEAGSKPIKEGTRSIHPVPECKAQDCPEASTLPNSYQGVTSPTRPALVELGVTATAGPRANYGECRILYLITSSAV